MLNTVESSRQPDKERLTTVEMFGDSYFLDNITEIGEYFKNESFTVTGHFINFLNERHSVNQEVDNTYNVSLAEENNTMERSLRELNKNLVGIKTELHTLDTSKLKDIDAVLDRMKTELHSMGDSLKKIEGKIKK